MANTVSTGRSGYAPAFCGLLTVCAVAWFATHPGYAQSPQPEAAPQAAPAEPSPEGPPPEGPPPPPAQEAPRKPDGFFDALGRWFDKSARDWKSSIDDANAKWKSSVEQSNAKFKASVDESNAKLKASVDENNARWRELGQRTEKAAKDAAAAQKEAADAFKNFANTRMVEGRQICELAPNGSPDCHAAAEVICKGKGFAIGKSADITTTRKCSARALLQRDASECRTETVVIKAACQ